MRILFVVPNMGYGGAERVISILANSFILKNHDVKIIMISSNEESVYKLNDKIEIQSIPSLNKRKPLTVFKHLKRLRKSINTYKPDVLISFIKEAGAITALANLGLNYPLVFSERCDPLNRQKGFSHMLFQIIVNYCAKGFVFQSNAARKLYPKRVQDSSTVIFNPINVNNLPTSHSGERRKEIVTVGRLDYQKNQRMLIEAFSEVTEKYPDYRLLIYGEGELKQLLQAKIDELNLTEKVLLMGTRSNVLKEINGASIYAFSSNFEGLPNSLIEAMALGLPCISTDWSPGAASNLIENYVNGIIVPVEDVKQLAKGLVYLISHPLEAEEMGNQAKRIVDKTKERVIVDEWEKFILSVAQKEKHNE